MITLLAVVFVHDIYRCREQVCYMEGGEIFRVGRANLFTMNVLDATYCIFLFFVIELDR